MCRPNLAVAAAGRRNHHPVRHRLRRQQHDQLPGGGGQRRRLFPPGRDDRRHSVQVRPCPVAGQAESVKCDGHRRPAFCRRDADSVKFSRQ